MLSPSQHVLARLRATDAWPFLRGAATAIAIQAGAMVLAYALQIVLARWLGVEQFGDYSMAYTVATLLAIAITFGVPSMLVRFLPAYEAHEDFARMRGAISFARRTVVLLGLVFSGTGTLVALVIHQLSAIGSLELVLGAIWLAPLLALLDLQMSTARAMRRISVGYIPQVVVVPGLLLVAAVVAGALGVGGGGALALVLCAVAALLVLPVQFFLIQRRLPSQVRTEKPATEHPVWLRSSAAFVFLVGFGVVLVQTDVLMLGHFAGSAAAGMYAAAAKTVTLTTLFYEGAVSMAAPMFAAAFAAGHGERLQRLAWRATCLATVPGTVIAILLVAYPGPILSLFGAGFAEAAPVVAILAIAHTFALSFGPNGYLLGATGHQRDQLVVNVCAVVLNAAAMVVVIPAAGLVGAGIVSGLMIVGSNVVLHAMVIRRIGIRPSIYAAVGEALARRREAASPAPVPAAVPAA